MIRRLAQFGPVWMALAVVLAVPACPAEVIVRKDGSRLQGRIVSQDAKQVVIEVRRHGARMVTTIDREKIDRILPDPAEKPGPDEAKDAEDTSDPQDGPGFVLLGLQGQIGVEVQPAFVDKALQLVAIRKVPHVVLELDLHGSDTEAAGTIVELIEKHARSRQIVAHVQSARGAGVAVALACETIAFRPKGLLTVRQAGQPNARADKAMTDLLLRAAAVGGHPAELARALADPRTELFLTPAEGKVVLSTVRGRQQISPAGRWLDLTAGLAGQVGLSVATTDEPSELYTRLGLSQWQRQYVGAEPYLRRIAGRARREHDEQVRRQRREQLLAKLKPELEEIDGRIRTIKAKAEALTKRKELLEQEYALRVETAEAEHEQILDRIEQMEEEDVNTRAVRREAEKYHEKKLESIRANYKPLVEQIRREARKLKEERRLLKEKREKLIESAGRETSDSQDR
jgi:hypothetical protein